MNKLKMQRELRELSQSQLAEQSGIKKRCLQQLEQDGRNINGTKLSTLLSLCNTLDCKLQDILTDQSLIESIKKYENRM